AMKELTFEFDPDTYVMKGIENPKDVLYEADAGALKLAVKEAGFFSWTGKPTFLRSDAQEGWVEIARQLRMCGDQQTTEYKCSDTVRSKRRDIQFLSPPWFKNESHAVALARIDRPQDRYAETPTEPRILVTDDGGKTWTLTDHKVPEPYCASLIAQVDDRLLLSCRGVNGDFFESFDDGASWTQVREHENF
ncbi:MAG: sialidase family protein, partial [Gammaproteobacteria bacterium]